jgi:hypothetical protein
MKLKFKKGDLVTTFTDFRRLKGVVLDVTMGGEYKVWWYDLNDWDIFGGSEVEHFTDG